MSSSWSWDQHEALAVVLQVFPSQDSLPPHPQPTPGGPGPVTQEVSDMSNNNMGCLLLLTLAKRLRGDGLPPVDGSSFLGLRAAQAWGLEG